MTARRTIDDPAYLARGARIIRAALARQQLAQDGSSSVAADRVTARMPRTRRTALYRHFDENNVLLYIGISSDPDRRARQHLAYSEWAKFAVHRTDEWLAHWDEALHAEGLAIAQETPVFNGTGPGGPEARDARIREYLKHRECP